LDDKHCIVVCAFQAISLSLFLLPAFYIKKNRATISWYIIFVLGWLSFDKIYEYSEIANPVYTLGNGFGGTPLLIQWYEITGAAGGSFWILIVNIFFFKVIQSILEDKPSLKTNLGFLIPLVILPLGLSGYLFKNNNTLTKNIETLILHTNLECAVEKKRLSKIELINDNIEHTKKGLSPNTKLIIWPETAIKKIGSIVQLKENAYVEYLDENFLSEQQNIPFVTGAAVSDSLNPDNKYNLALSINTQSTENRYLQYRSKQRLVPFMEVLPYRNILKILKGVLPFSMNFKVGESMNTNIDLDQNISYTPFICYETCFGELMAERVKNKADFLVLISNEGWYKSLLSAQQFFYLSKIRAIENRRYIAKSSNGGISGIINEKGQVVTSTFSEATAVLKGDIGLSDHITFFTKYAFYIGRGIIFMYIFLLFYAFVFTKKKLQ